MNTVFRDSHGVWWLIERRGIRRLPPPGLLRRLVLRWHRLREWLRGE